MIGDTIPETCRLLPIASEVTGISVRRLRTWIKAGKIQCYQLGNLAVGPRRRLYLVDLAELVDHVPYQPTVDYAMRLKLAAHARKFQKNRKAPPAAPSAV